MGAATERTPTAFHLFTVPVRQETEAAQDLLRAAGLEHTALHTSGGAARAEVVLTGTAPADALAEVVAALRHRLRHGVVVRRAGPRDVVVRSDPGVAHGRILVRRPHRDVEVRDAAGLRGALNIVLAEGAQPSPQRSDAAAPGPYARSRLFEGEQNRALAAEAIRLARVFADPDFVRGAQPVGAGSTRDLLEDLSALAGIAEKPRVLLDLLLLAHACSRTDDGDHRKGELRLPGMGEARRLARTVEVFVQPSTEPEARTLTRPLPDGRRERLIGVPPQASELMANLSWALPTLYGVVEGGGDIGSAAPDRERVWADVDGSVASYLRSWRPGRGAVLLPPRPLIPMTMPEGEVRHGSGDPFVVFDACNLFLIARELVPILYGRPDDEGGVRFPLPPFTAGLPREVRRELAADCEAYVLTMNALVLASGENGPHVPDFDNIRRHFHGGRPSRFGRTRRLEEQARHDAEGLLRSMHRATEAVLCYFAVMDMFAALARVRGDSVLARHLEAVADRRETVCAYMLEVKRNGLPKDWGLRTWREGEEDGWERLRDYVRHVQQHLVPLLGDAGTGAGTGGDAGTGE
ncbi:hypothetical protein [Streptomyces sp. NPDC050263]|uniref:hypothetical protein n=1 Tax=Streptomyces sp. NPDC050263 TaxID=3155037 RepID=UPI00343DA2CA